jgi:hypothetical protein
VGAARHLGRLAWDDPPLSDLPVLPFVRSTTHPSEQAPAGEPLFGLVSPASRLDSSEPPSISTVARGDRRRGSWPPPLGADHWRHDRLPALRPSTNRAPGSPFSDGLAAAGTSPASQPSTPVHRGRRCRHRCPELWVIPRIVVRSDPDQARPPGLRQSSSPGGPDRRAPIRGPRPQRPFNGSAGIFAVFHALHRLLTPRHPPHALISLAALTPDPPRKARTRVHRFKPSCNDDPT